MGTPQIGVRVTSLLQLDQPDREPVQVTDDVKPSLVVALGHRHLVGDQVVVGSLVPEVDQPNGRVVLGTMLVGVKDRSNALDHQLVQPPILSQGVPRAGAEHIGDCLIDLRGGSCGLSRATASRSRPGRISSAHDSRSPVPGASDDPGTGSQPNSPNASSASASHCASVRSCESADPPRLMSRPPQHSRHLEPESPPTSVRAAAHRVGVRESGSRHCGRLCHR